MTNENIKKELEFTKEYKQWQKSFLAIIGYIQDAEVNDEDLAEELMADHINASLELSKGLERVRDEAGKKRKDDFQDFRMESRDE